MVIKTAFKWSMIYLAGVMSQMILAVILKYLLVKLQIENGMTKMILLAMGGLSSALWGCVIQIKSHEAGSIKKILKDFFNVVVSWKYYLFTLSFLLIIYGKQIVSMDIVENGSIQLFLVLFIQALLFGGIEEIGWRYTFQPGIETRLPYVMSVICTFICWGSWHYMYFYITGTLTQIVHVSFLLGLLTSCFVLGAIYHQTKNLWLCVFYHAMFNALSQCFTGGRMPQTIVVTVACVVLSIIVVRMNIFKQHEEGSTGPFCEGGVK